LLILYTYSEKRLKINDSAITNSESAIVRGDERTAASYQISQKPLIFKPNSSSIIQDDAYYSALFKNHEVKTEDAIKVQKILKTIGYKIAGPDGLINKNTVLCLKQYSIDFGYIPKENFPGCFFENSFFHYQIALEHNDWLDIYLTGDLKHWIDTQSDDYRNKIYELALEKPNTVVQLLRRYKFDKYKPLPKLLPETSVIKKNFLESNGPIKIKTRAGSNNYYIKLINLQNNQEILSAFIRSGSTLSAHIPLGVYELKYAAGHNWYGLEYLFGTSTSYAKLPVSIIFLDKSSEIGKTTIELIPSQYGNLTNKIISEFDF
jgi:hypothetical protein